MKLGGVADTPVGCAAVQRHLDRLEKWAVRSLVESNKGMCQALPWAGVALCTAAHWSRSQKMPLGSWSTK